MTHPLRRWRQAQQPPMTQEQLAAKIGIRQAMISTWEAGTIPSPRYIAKLLAVTAGAVTAEDLLGLTVAPEGSEAR